MHEFRCRHRYANEESHEWSGFWELLDRTGNQVELLVRGRGSEYRVITGTGTTGNYLCIPTDNVGCSLAELDDVFWNTERLSGLMNPTDAVTITNAIRDYNRH